MQLDQIGPTDAMRRAFDLQKAAKKPVLPPPVHPSAEERKKLRETKGERVFHNGREYIVLRGVTFTSLTKDHPETPSGYKVFRYVAVPNPNFEVSGGRKHECLPVAIYWGDVQRLRVLFEVWEAYGDYNYLWLDGDKEVKLT